MAISNYTLYKYVKVEGAWRYCKAAYHENGKIKPDVVFVNVKERLLEKHCEGRYYLGWGRAPADHAEKPVPTVTARNSDPIKVAAAVPAISKK